ncbi:helix-hairpin-helix domain-containing protein [Frisingicoccus sp.]|uniref:helix-hairpin-helix domain-containing protein n=1 Tax=Frisingicoccus sp. TaxID=1918627 RepID=UPI003AB3D105
MSAYKIWILILCSVIFIGGCRSEEILLESGEAPVEAAEGEESEITEETSEDLIYVYVCGRVKAPGVYAVRFGDRWVHALELAGGPLPEADLSGVNLASVLADGDKVYIPAEGETGAAYDGETGDSRVDINRASKDQLMTLPGIGEAKAEAIIAYRRDEGLFTAPEELMKVPGIKAGVYDQMKDSIRID